MFFQFINHNALWLSPVISCYTPADYYLYIYSFDWKKQSDKTQSMSEEEVNL